MFNLTPFKLMVIVAIALVLLGPDKLPTAAKKVGETWRALKGFQQRIEADVREVMPDLPSSADLARVVRSPVNLLNELAERAESAARGVVDDGPVTGDGEEVAPAQTAQGAPAVVTKTSEPPPPPDPSWN